MEEKLTKRTIFVAKCDCDKEDPFYTIKLESPPREILCPKCGTWIPFVMESWIGNDKFSETPLK